jgi:hypothetical protein
MAHLTYRGANVSGGALGQFLAAVENGRVPKGSYLIVESRVCLAVDFLPFLNTRSDLKTGDTRRIRAVPADNPIWDQPCHSRGRASL